MFAVNRLLESIDLVPYFTGLALAGVFLALIAMQMSWNEAIQRGVDTPVTMNLRRASFVAVALSLLWSLSYAETTGWQPWPPALAMVGALDFYFAVLIAIIVVKARRGAGPVWKRAGGRFHY
jgi:hypothetical protein